MLVWLLTAHYVIGGTAFSSTMGVYATEWQCAAVKERIAPITVYFTCDMTVVHGTMREQRT